MIKILVGDALYSYDEKSIQNDNLYEFYSKLTIKTPKGRWRHSDVFIVNLKQISHTVLVFPLLNLNKQM